MDPEASPNRVTLKDIAKSAGVSLATVSFALRGDRRFTKACRDKIKAIAEAMGYQSNAAATALVQLRRCSTVKPIQDALAWINAWHDPKALRELPDYDLYWKGAFKAAQKFGYRLDEFLISEEITPHRLQNILLARNIRRNHHPATRRLFGAK